VDEQQLHSLPPAAPPPQAAVVPPTRITLQQAQQRVSAFEVYRKPQTPRAGRLHGVIGGVQKGPTAPATAEATSACAKQQLGLKQVQNGRNGRRPAGGGELWPIYKQFT